MEKSAGVEVNYFSDTVFNKRVPPIWMVVLLAAFLVTGGCAGKDKKKPGKTILSTRSGETGIQVTESEEGGGQVVRVTTTYRGEESVIVLAIDQAVYEVEIPLSIGQIRPKAPGGGGAGGNFQDLLVAQYLEKAQSAMIEGNYNEALRQVNLVLMVQPEHVKSHEMKGSIYYAMGSYQLANEEWEQVLTYDPSNEEVRKFMDWTSNQQGLSKPPLPGGAAGSAGPPSPTSAPQSPAPQQPQPQGGAPQSEGPPPERAAQ